MEVLLVVLGLGFGLRPVRFLVLGIATWELDSVAEVQIDTYINNVKGMLRRWGLENAEILFWVK
jgi:hypothetical protein